MIAATTLSVACVPSPTGGGEPTTTTLVPKGTIQIAGGAGHTCALLADHTVKCWGNNEYGQLGNTTNNGTNSPNPTPTLVAGLSDVTQITAGNADTCALLTNQTVTCWGLNDFGELGNTTNYLTLNPNPKPTVVAGVSGVAQITGTFDHTCALLTSGTVTCWGENSYGELGTTTNIGDDNPTPTVVAGLSDVTEITAGFLHTCALLTNGTVTCWGYNYYGELGNTTNNSTTNPNPTPTVVVGLSGVTQITAGSEDTCALLTDHTVSCWGYSIWGQLGIPFNFIANPTPTTVAGLSGVTQIDTDGNHTCALLTDHIVSCWGDNEQGQLGNTASSGSSDPNPTPTVVAGLSGVAQISTGYLHTCALLSDGTASCWGFNLSGELGNTTNSGTTNPNPTPTMVNEIP
jgi:alpha-tubulin suppressor-like RCC1 family protein